MPGTKPVMIPVPTPKIKAKIISKNIFRGHDSDY